MEYRYLVNTTKAAMEAFPRHHVIVDSGRLAVGAEAAVNGHPVMALCPITKDDAPLCEGQFSFAPVVQRALETHAELAAAAIDFARLIMVERYPREDIAVGAAYERLRIILAKAEVK